MDIAALLLQAANLMLTGMVVVFVFLLLLIVAVKLMSYFLREPAEPLPEKTKTNTTSSVNSAHIAAISAAVHQYQQSSKE